MSAGAINLTEANTLGLFFINRYRFLTIAQYAAVSGLSRAYAEDALLRFARQDIVGSFGNVVIAGHGKTPKVYLSFSGARAGYRRSFSAVSG